MREQNLQVLNNEIRRKFEAGEASIFRMSFDLSDEVLTEVYLTSSERLPYLRIACWMREVFLHGNGRGFKPHWTQHQASFSLEAIWKEVFHEQDLTLYDVKSRIWLLRGNEHGYTSDIWDAIALCRDKDEGSSGDIFQPASYQNDDPPHHLNLLLEAYQRDSINGREFAELILAVRKKETAEEGGGWYSPLLQAVQEKFRKEESLFWDFYLRWVEGGGVATNIFGVESPSGTTMQRHIEIDGERWEIVMPIQSRTLEFGGGHSARYHRKMKVMDGNPTGVYQPYMSTAKDDRKHWWKRINPWKNSDTDGDTDNTSKQHERAVRHGCCKVLVCSDREDDIANRFSAAGFEGVQVAEHDVAIKIPEGGQQSFHFYLVTFEKRPDTEIQLELNGESIRFAGAMPVLWANGQNGTNVRVDGAVLMGGNIEMTVEHMTGVNEWEWEINGQKQATSNKILKIDARKDSFLDYWITCRPIVAGHRKAALHRHAIIFPQEVLDALEERRPLPGQWAIDTETESCNDAVGLRAQNLKRIVVVAPEGGQLTLYCYTEDADWWFEGGKDIPRLCDCRDFSRIEDIESFWLCIPENTPEKVLTVNGSAYKFHEGQLHDGVFRVPMATLCRTDRVEYRHGGEVSTMEIFFNGRAVCHVKMVPAEPTFCRTVDEDGWGVYLPRKHDNRVERYDIALISDSITESDLVRPPCLAAGENGLEWKRSEEDSFVDLSKTVAAFKARHPTGEVLAVLIPRKKCDVHRKLLIEPFFMSGNGTTYPMTLVHSCVQDYTEDSRTMAAILQARWCGVISTLNPGHPWQASRLWKTYLRAKQRKSGQVCHKEQSQSVLKEAPPVGTALEYSRGSGYWRVLKNYPELWNDTLWTLLQAQYNFLSEPAGFFRTSEEGLTKDVASARFNNRRTQKVVDLVKEGLKKLSPLAETMLVIAKSTAIAAQCAEFNAANDAEVMRAIKELVTNEELGDDDTVLQEQCPGALEFIHQYVRELSDKLIDNAFCHETSEMRRKRKEKLVFMGMEIRNAGANDRTLMALVAFCICLSYQWSKIASYALSPFGKGYEGVLDAVKTAYQHKYIDDDPDPEPWKHLLGAISRAHVLLWYAFKKQNQFPPTEEQS